MHVLLRGARAYWRFAERGWDYARRAAIPLLAMTGAGSAVAWAIGAHTGNTMLMWAPALYGSVLFVSFSLARN